MKKDYRKTLSPIKCPSCKVNNAVIDPSYGVIHCTDCQQREHHANKSPEFYSISKIHRIQAMRDNMGKDLLQPYISNKPNKEFFEAFPDQASEYGVTSELEKL